MSKKDNNVDRLRLACLFPKLIKVIYIIQLCFPVNDKFILNDVHIVLMQLACLRKTILIKGKSSLLLNFCKKN